jgi:hypothetical protein
MFDAGARGNLCEKPTAVERTRVNQQAHAMLEQHNEVDVDPDEVNCEYKVTKQQRVKAYQVLRGLDHALLITMGVGALSVSTPTCFPYCLFVWLVGAGGEAWFATRTHLADVEVLLPTKQLL